MALSRFVVTATVNIPAGTASAISNGFGLEGWAGPAGPPQQWAAGMPVTFRPGDVIYADSAGGSSTGAQQLYNAIGAGNLRPYVQGRDDVGHAAPAN